MIKQKQSGTVDDHDELDDETGEPSDAANDDALEQGRDWDEEYARDDAADEDDIDVSFELDPEVNDDDDEVGER